MLNDIFEIQLQIIINEVLYKEEYIDEQIYYKVNEKLLKSIDLLDKKVIKG